MSAVVVDQFTRQAASFARLPSHEDSTQLLLDMAGVDSGCNVLDVACGPGMVACAAAARARHVTGVDLTPAMIGQARALQVKLGLCNVDWQVGEASALPFGDAAFDAVTTRYSCHHFPDPDLVVAELVRVAKPGARVAIADMVLPRAQGAAYDRMERLRDPSHVRTLTREELITLATGAGLRDPRCAGYSFTVDLERLLKASFPRPGDSERVRAMFEADVGVDRMGLGLARVDGVITLTYPVAIVAGNEGRLKRLRRTWLFVPGADPAAHDAAARSGADVLIQELEDFTPPGQRPRARALAANLYAEWRRKGCVAAVRVNPLETCGREDLAAVLKGRPDVVMMSKVVSPDQVRALEQATAGAVDLVPNVETAAGLLQAFQIGTASKKTIAMLVASEDMVADLGAARSRGGEELAYVRERFLVECRAAGVEAIDAPYTFSDVKGAVAEAKRAKRLGYRMKSLVSPQHAAALNAVFSVSARELKAAQTIVEAFEAARAAGRERARVDGRLVEVPVYSAAKRLLARAGR